MIRALKSRDVFAVGCEISPLYISCKLYCFNPENPPTRDRELVDVDTTERYPVILPNLLSNPSYNVQIPRQDVTITI